MVQHRITVGNSTIEFERTFRADEELGRFLAWLVLEQLPSSAIPEALESLRSIWEFHQAVRTPKPLSLPSRGPKVSVARVVERAPMTVEE